MKKVSLKPSFSITVPTSIQALPEWAAYSSDPNRDTFNSLMLTARNNNLWEPALLAVYANFSQSPYWKTAQHLAVLFDEISHLTAAGYFAHLALKMSNGNIWSRIVLARILWERRLPRAVLFQTTIIRQQARKLKDRRLRRIAQLHLAELMVTTYSYTRDVDKVRSWIKYLLKYGSVRTDTAIQVVFGARSAGANDLYILAARTLAYKDQSMFGGRLKSAISRGVKLALCNCLRQIK